MIWVYHRVHIAVYTDIVSGYIQTVGCYRQWLCQGMARRGLCPSCKPLCPGHAPAGKPSSFYSVMQRQFFEFHSTIFHTNRGQLFGAHGTRREDSESKFSKIIQRSRHQSPLLWDMGYAILHHMRSASTPLLGPRLLCPLRRFGAPLVLQ